MGVWEQRPHDRSQGPMLKVESWGRNTSQGRGAAPLRVKLIYYYKGIGSYFSIREQILALILLDFLPICTLFY